MTDSPSSKQWRILFDAIKQIPVLQEQMREARIQTDDLRRRTMALYSDFQTSNLTREAFTERATPLKKELFLMDILLNLAGLKMRALLDLVGDCKENFAYCSTDKL